MTNITFIGLIPEYCALFILFIIMYINNRKMNSKIIENTRDHLINKDFVICEWIVLILILIDIIRYSTDNIKIEYISAIIFHCAIVIMANSITTYIYDILPSLKEKSAVFYKLKNKITASIIILMIISSPTGLIYKLKDNIIITGKVYFFSYLVGGVMFLICMIGAYRARVSRRIKNSMYLIISCVYLPCIFEVVYKKSITSGIGFVAGILLLYHMFQDGVFDMTHGTESFGSMIKYLKLYKHDPYKIILFNIKSIDRNYNELNFNKKHNLLLELKQNFESETMFKSNDKYAFVINNIDYDIISKIWKRTTNKYNNLFDCKAIVINKDYINNINISFLSKIQINDNISNFDDSNIYKIERNETIKRTIQSIVSNEDYNDSRLITYIQPIINLKEQKFLTGEMLTRIKVDGIDDIIMPNEFIPIIEDLKCTHKFNLMVLNSACKLIKKLQMDNIIFDSISVNFDPIELTSDTFTSDVANIVYKNGILPSSIHIEITETTEISDMEKTNKCINDLINLGFSIYLDDFGTKYSNLLELLNCKFNVIKIDRQLILKALDDKVSKKIITALSSACNAVGYKVLFEGVDSEKGVELAHKIGASYIQGFYYSKPLSWNDFIIFLKQNNAQMDT